MDNNLYIKNVPLEFKEEEVKGQYVDIKGERFYKIANSDLMRPFFMSIVSDSDHWMFISSNGAISAGRKNSDHSLFPYYTDDKITDSKNITGNKTIILADLGRKRYFWEPFSSSYQGIYKIQRNLYKNYYGNKVLFEEINEDLGLSFSYCWCNSDKFGFVKKSQINNLTDSTIKIEVLDGIQNILPSGIGEDVQNINSTLVDAYKKNELDEKTGLGMYMLSAVIVDRPVPSESLTTTIAYAVGVNDAQRLICTKQLQHFKKGLKVIQETDIRAERGAYFVNFNKDVVSKDHFSWMIVTDVDKDHADIAYLNNLLTDGRNLTALINNDIDKGTENLINIVANADGLQMGEDEVCNNRHFANVLFNVMRGGLPDYNYLIPQEDFKEYISLFNKELYKKHDQLLEGLTEGISYPELISWASNSGDADLERLSFEYLPFIFSRRHGDPSRPWNKFSINLKDEQGKKEYKYEGNWRDIFQNWEAMAISYPHFINGMITKFLNASTIDGYNPYRITKEGIDWEVIEPDNPWSFIGYWGDHQIIYFQKLLEISYSTDRSGLEALINKNIFSYSNVPYKIKPYKDIVDNPRDTIIFDEEKEAKINERVKDFGIDGKMILTKSGDVLKASFTEKILVMILTKFSNFIPGAGIWLNTQRPEWNDANNALVGNGVSMVTLYYMYRYQLFAKHLFTSLNIKSVQVDSRIKLFLEEMTNTFLSFEESLIMPLTDETRRRIVDDLGLAGEVYRESSYDENFDNKNVELDLKDILLFIDISIKYLAHTIKTNKREDGLYHTYNLVDLNDNKMAKISRLYEMLEGQVSVLSAGYLDPEGAVEVLDALKDSALFREDQYSYILYPNKELPRFQDKNTIPEESIVKSSLLQKLIEDDNKELIYTDADGACHFNVTFNNNENLKLCLEKLKTTKYGSFVKKDKRLILNIYEEMFDHKSFTGRSGTFYGYEGLGSIYWHMVSKLLLAVYENYFWAMEKGANDHTIGKLVDHYYSIRAGLGNNKSPELYGAFPMDPYSHTPAHKGAQQPGMTGQVKEDILARFGELGVIVNDGRIKFIPSLFRRSELLLKDSLFEYYNINNLKKSIPLKKGTFAFTYCKVPITYSESNKNEILIKFKDGNSTTIEGHGLNREISNMIFSRKGEIVLMEISFLPRQLGI